jgi:hypothetical protein
LAGLVLQQQYLGGVDSSTAISLPFGEAATQVTSLSIGVSAFFSFVLCNVVIGFAIIPDLGKFVTWSFASKIFCPLFGLSPPVRLFIQYSHREHS